MSYILDALARSHTAEAQRGLRTLSKRSWWQTIAIGVLLAIVVALGVAYFTTGRQARPAPADPALAGNAQAARDSASDVPSMAARPARKASAPAAGTTATVLAGGATATALAVAAPARTVAAPVRAEPRFSPPVALSQPLPNPSPQGPGGAYVAARTAPVATSPFQGAVATAAAAAATRVVSVSDLKPLSALPPDIRQAISQMKIRVLFYTPQRRGRFVLIDGRELREGDELFDGVRLEEITDTGLVLKHGHMLVLSPATLSP